MNSQLGVLAATLGALGLLACSKAGADGSSAPSAVAKSASAPAQPDRFELKADVGGLPAAAYPRLVAVSPDLAGFAPSGWKVEHMAEGDLNGDQRTDIAFVLRQTAPANILAYDGLCGATFDTNPRILAVAFARSEGGYGLIEQNHTLIARPDKPCLEDVLEGEPLVIKAGTLRVVLNLFMSAGGWTAGHFDYTFRYQDGRFMLIGYDSVIVARNTGEVTEVSANMLTRKVKVSTGAIDSEAMTSRWRSLKPSGLLTIEGVGDGLQYDPLRGGE